MVLAGRKGDVEFTVLISFHYREYLVIGVCYDDGVEALLLVSLPKIFSC